MREQILISKNEKEVKNILLLVTSVAQFKLKEGIYEYLEKDTYCEYFQYKINDEKSIEIEIEYTDNYEFVCCRVYEI